MKRGTLFNLLYIFFGLIGLIALLISIFIFYQINSSGLATIDQANLVQYINGTAGFFISITSIVALIIAFIVQKQQIIDQQIEFEKNALNNKKQTIENNFFQLLKVYQYTLEQINYIEVERDISGTKHYHDIFGKKAIEKYYEMFTTETLHHFQNDESNEYINNPRLLFNRIYMSYIQIRNNTMGHYFRIIFHIMKYIYINRNILSENEDIVGEDEKFYINILRSQLSSRELLFVFYNGLTDIALYNSTKINFKKLLERYTFFEHLSVTHHGRSHYGLLLEKYAVTELLDFYDRKAYGDSYDLIRSNFES